MAWGIGLALPVAVVAPRSAALVAVLAVVADVGQQRDLAGPLDGRGDLVLVAAAGARDAARADLAAVGHVLLEGRDVLVVDLIDLVAAVAAGLAAAGTGAALLVTPARRPAALLRHCGKNLARRSRSRACGRWRRGARKVNSVGGRGRSRPAPLVRTPRDGSAGRSVRAARQGRRGVPG